MNVFTFFEEPYVALERVSYYAFLSTIYNCFFNSTDFAAYNKWFLL